MRGTHKESQLASSHFSRWFVYLRSTVYLTHLSETLVVLGAAVLPVLSPHGEVRQLLLLLLLLQGGRRVLGRRELLLLLEMRGRLVGDLVLGLDKITISRPLFYTET